MSPTRPIPQNWCVAALGELGSWTGGGTPSKANPSFWTNGTIPWVSAKDMKRFEISDSIDRITEDAVIGSAAKLIAPGSVLFVMRSGILAHTFPVAHTTAQITINQDLRALSPAEGVLPEYVAYGVRASGQEILRTMSKDGTTVASVDATMLAGFELPLAPSAEQERIVEALESYFSRIEDAERLLERAKRNLERYRASVLKAAVEGRLVPSEAESARSERRDYQPAIALLDEILAAKSKESTRRRPAVTRTAEALLPDLPEGWCWIRAGQTVTTPLTNGRSVRSASSGFPVLRLTALREGSVDLSEQKIGAWTKEDAKPAIVSEGDFLVSRGSGSIRLVGIGGVVGPVTNPVAFPDTMIRFRLSPRISAKYFAYVWNSRVVRDQLEARAKTTAGIYKLNQGDLEACVLPLPPRAEQDRIVEELDRILSAADACAALNRSSTTRCSVLRQSVLDWAFQGRLVDQDPSDEPVSDLLARIRAARHSSETKQAKRRPRRKPNPSMP